MSWNERRRSLRRTNAILNMISKGLSSSELNDEVGKMNSREEGNLARGKESEDRVEIALLELPMVRKVSRIKQYSDRDMSGLDMKIHLNSRKVKGHFGFRSNLDYVWAQIKSSNDMAQKFRERYRYENVSGSEISELSRHKMIVLVGQNSPDQIHTDFLNELSNVWSFWSH